MHPGVSLGALSNGDTFPQTTQCEANGAESATWYCMCVHLGTETQVLPLERRFPVLTCEKQKPGPSSCLRVRETSSAFSAGDAIVK